MEKVSVFNPQQLEAVARILADTDAGLKGSQIAYLLRDCKIPDVSQDMTKWKRLFNAFVEIQNRWHFGNHVLMFINRAMDPVAYTGTPEVFASRQAQLNSVLSFCGMAVGDDGKVKRAAKARDLDDAIARADRLHKTLATRNVHSDVLKFCRAELLDKNYFHAVFEAMKSIASKVRTLSGLTSDGADLVQQAFGTVGGRMPLLVINSLATETERGEQRGFVNLLIGLFGTIRNPAAHNPKIEWDMSEQDALDILTMASLVHRKLDKVQRSTSAP
jgi:uncharacterized protein (TIGR02391 family)